MFLSFFRKEPKENNKQRDYDNFFVFLLSYRNMIFNHLGHVFSLGYFLKYALLFIVYPQEC